MAMCSYRKQVILAKATKKTSGYLHSFAKMITNNTVTFLFFMFQMQDVYPMCDTMSRTVVNYDEHEYSIFVIALRPLLYLLYTQCVDIAMTDFTLISQYKFTLL